MRGGWAAPINSPTSGQRSPVPFGKCSNPQNVAAEGYGCPIRHRCFGCASFSSDPSYLPEMRRRLLDLKAIRARVDAFDGASEWAKRDARPSDEEIESLQAHARWLTLWNANLDEMYRGPVAERAKVRQNRPVDTPPSERHRRQRTRRIGRALTPTVTNPGAAAATPPVRSWPPPHGCGTPHRAGTGSRSAR